MLANYRDFLQLAQIFLLLSGVLIWVSSKISIVSLKSKCFSSQISHYKIESLVSVYLKSTDIKEDIFAELMQPWPGWLGKKTICLIGEGDWVMSSWPVLTVTPKLSGPPWKLKSLKPNKTKSKWTLHKTLSLLWRW